ncbi:MAG: DUF3520 domain-containing protein [Nitrospinae bacterium]|nr:DUF3520 domain-containing protein [Nitrospinota bacterium]
MTYRRARTATSTSSTTSAGRCIASPDLRSRSVAQAGAQAGRYSAESKKPATDFGNEYAFLKIRYKLPGQAASTLITAPITGQKQEMASALEREIQWATAVAGFGQLLRGGKYTGKLTYDDVIEQAQSAKGKDEFGYRSEFIQLVRLAKSAAAMPH